jgi:hypothetical protein
MGTIASHSLLFILSRNKHCHIFSEGVIWISTVGFGLFFKLAGGRPPRFTLSSIYGSV